MKGKDKNLDMTSGSIWRNMVAFAVPVFLGQLFQQLYNTADSIIVGNFSGKGALAAVASSGNLIFMMTGFFMGLSLGAGVVISRYFGAKDYKAMEAAVHTNIAFGAVCGVLMSVLGIFLAPQMLIIMNTPEDVLPLSTTYFRLYFLGAFFSLMYNTCMGILRAVGDSKTPLYYLIFSSVVNPARLCPSVRTCGRGARHRNKPGRKRRYVLCQAFARHRTGTRCFQKNPL